MYSFIKRKKFTDYAEDLEASLRVVAQCRFNASKRIARTNAIATFTVVTSSLVLATIPILQLAGVEFRMQNAYLNAFQIIIAITVLVYSSIISKSNYEVRASKLNDCGDKLKKYSRRVKKLIGKTDADEELEVINRKYYTVVNYTENHENIDFYRAVLEMEPLFPISNLERRRLIINVFIARMFKYIIPGAIMTVHILLIIHSLDLYKNCLLFKMFFL